MERLTTNKPVEEMNMTELARNSCYAKDGYAWYRDFETDIDARELARDLMLNWGFFELDSDEMLSDEIFDETMMDNLQYGSKEIEGLIALFYRNLWAMADLHSRLRAYEDAEEQGLLLRLPCKVREKVFYVQKCLAPSCKKCKGFLHVDNCYCQYKSRIFEQEFDYRHLKAFGKSVFLTKEEAEQALAKMEKSHE